jgi:Helix-turn-helix of DDE superfamily endonuclease
MRYADVNRKDQKCLDFTSLTVEEFEKLVPVFEEEFQEHMKNRRLDGKERIGRKYQTYVTCPLPTPEDRLFFILTYLKTNNLQVVHGGLFGMSQGKANQWIQTLLPVLQAALRKLGDAPARSMEELAHRLGKAALPVLSLNEAKSDKTLIEAMPATPDDACVAQDSLQNMSICASEVSNAASVCSIDVTEEKYDSPTSSPFFAMMGQKDGSNGQKTMKNRKSITVERKRLIP